MQQPRSPFSRLLSYWRSLRGLTQQDLALLASTSPRHASFLETGRSRPSEEMVMRLAEVLDVPIRDRNDLLEAAGLAPLFSQHDLSAEALEPFLKAIRYNLRVCNPLPAFVLNRHYDIIESNEAARRLFDWDDSGVAMNQIEMMYGMPMMRQFIDNWGAVAWAMIYRLRREAALTPPDDRLRELVAFANDQLVGVPHPDWDPDEELVICPHYHLEGHLIRTIDMISRFGITREITTDELRIRTIYPRDAEAEAFFFKELPGGM